MTPRAEHVEDLRQKLLARTVPAASVGSPPAAKPRWTARWLWPIVAAAAAVTAGLSLWDNPRSSAWAQVQKAFSSVPWIRMRVEQQDGTALDTWLSPRMAVMAVKGAVPQDDQQVWALFADLPRGLRYEYQPLDNTIVRYPALDADTEGLRMYDQFFAALLRDADVVRLTGRQLEVCSEQRQAIQRDGRRLWKYTITSLTKRPRKGELKTEYFIDPQSSLPISAVATVNGQRQTISFDYPADGPHDIYALGAPNDARIVDRVPPPELDRLLEQRIDARRNFDSYYGVLVWVRDGKHWSQGTQVKRIWRSGARWRIEYLFADPADDTLRWNRDAAPDDANPREWWFAQVQKERFRPVLLSDGETAYRFDFDAIKTDDPKRWELEVQLAKPDYYPLDTENPVPSAVILPEYHAYGLTGLPSSKRTGTITLSRKVGPKGTVLIESKTSGPAVGAKKNDLSLYWVDPLNDGMTRKQQMLSLFGGARELLVEEEVLETARTPKGYLYPTKLRRGEGVIHFYLDFDATIDDGVFDPNLTKAAP